MDWASISYCHTFRIKITNKTLFFDNFCFKSNYGTLNEKHDVYILVGVVIC